MRLTSHQRISVAKHCIDAVRNRGLTLLTLYADASAADEGHIHVVGLTATAPKAYASTIFNSFVPSPPGIQTSTFHFVVDHLRQLYVKNGAAHLFLDLETAANFEPILTHPSFTGRSSAYVRDLLETSRQQPRRAIPRKLIDLGFLYSERLQKICALLRKQIYQHEAFEKARSEPSQWARVCSKTACLQRYAAAIHGIYNGTIAAPDAMPLPDRLVEIELPHWRTLAQAHPPPDRKNLLRLIEVCSEDYGADSHYHHQLSVASPEVQLNLHAEGEAYSPSRLDTQAWEAMSDPCRLGEVDPTRLSNATFDVKAGVYVPLNLQAVKTEGLRRLSTAAPFRL